MSFMKQASLSYNTTYLSNTCFTLFKEWNMYVLKYLALARITIEKKKRNRFLAYCTAIKRVVCNGVFFCPLQFECDCDHLHKIVKIALCRTAIAAVLLPENNIRLSLAFVLISVTSGTPLTQFFNTKVTKNKKSSLKIQGEWRVQYYKVFGGFFLVWSL